MPAERVRSASPTLEELEEKMRLKREKLAREAEEKRLAEEAKKRAEEEAAKKAAEAAKAKRKATEDDESEAGPSKKPKTKGKGRVEETPADTTGELADSACQR